MHLLSKFQKLQRNQAVRCFGKLSLFEKAAGGQKYQEILYTSSMFLKLALLSEMAEIQAEGASLPHSRYLSLRECQYSF